MRRQTTIIHTGGIGDFVQTWPVLEELRRSEPQRRIVILGRPERAALAVAGGLADEAADFETSGCHRLFAAGAGEEDLPAALRDAELVINFLPQAEFNANLERLARGRVVGARSFPTAGETELPAAQYVYEQVAAKLGWAPVGEAIPRLWLKADAAATKCLAARFPQLSETVAIHPGSGSAKKNWRRDGFEELAGRLVEDGVPVMWILGPAETETEKVTASPSDMSETGAPSPYPLPSRERGEEEAEETEVTASPIHLDKLGTYGSAGGFISNSTSIAVLRNAPLVEVARVLGGVRGYVGNDSGITHLAAAVGAATVAIWGPTERRVWAPRGARVSVVGGEASAGEVLKVLYGTM